MSEALAIDVPGESAGHDRRQQARRVQWRVTFVVYVASGLIMGLGVHDGVIAAPSLAGWCLFVSAGLVFFYVLIIGGRAERWPESTLSEAQIVFGIAAVLWAYLICGVWRSATLFPLMLILTFGAFASSWRRLAALTALALLGLAACVGALYAIEAPGFDLRADLASLLVLCVMLPTCSLVAARLSALRQKLHGQRDELSRALADVQRLATQDELTGLKNQRRMQELLELEHRRCVRSGHTFCLALLDVDSFEEINRLHGRAVGDQLLRSFAADALGVMRASDMLARWGGDEFMLMMPDTRAALARLGVERLRERAEAHRIDGRGTPVGFTLSAGLVEHRAGESVGDAIGRADKALQVARSLGGNRVLVS